jgi:hypothetical protein
MTGAYRSFPRHIAPHPDDVDWRIRVARTAGVLIALFLLGAITTVIFIVSPDGLVDRAYQLVTIALAAAEAICGWVLTTPRPNARTWPARQAWTLRAFASASAILHLVEIPFPEQFAPMVYEGGVLVWIHAFVHTCLAPAGLWYMSALFRELGMPNSALMSRMLALGTLGAFGGLLYTPGSSFPVVLFQFLAALLIFACLVCGFVLFVILRRALSVALHEWWVDPSDVANPKWASLVVSGAGVAQVMMVDGEHLQFFGRMAAVSWLANQGFIEGKRVTRAEEAPGRPPVLQRVAATLLSNPID